MSDSSDIDVSKLGSFLLLVGRFQRWRLDGFLALFQRWIPNWILWFGLKVIGVMTLRGVARSFLRALQALCRAASERAKTRGGDWWDGHCCLWVVDSW